MSEEKRLIDAKNDKEKVLRAICAVSNNTVLSVVRRKDGRITKGE